MTDQWLLRVPSEIFVGFSRKSPYKINDLAAVPRGVTISRLVRPWEDRVDAKPIIDVPPAALRNLDERPKERLGLDNRPLAHMWRTMLSPSRSCRPVILKTAFG